MKYASNFFSFIRIVSFTVFVFVLVSFQPTKAFSQDEMNTLVKLLKAQKNFQSKYQQKVFQANGELYESSKGHFYLGSNKAFRNDTDFPDSGSVLSDGKKLWIIDHDLEQVSISRLEDQLKNSPLVLLLDEPEKALQHFEIKTQEDSKNVFQLKQKDQYSAFPFIRLAFNNSQIKYIEIDEASGKKIRIEFENISSLKDQGIFKADFPESYDVVDESH